MDVFVNPDAPIASSRVKFRNAVRGDQKSSSFVSSLDLASTCSASFPLRNISQQSISSGKENIDTPSAFRRSKGAQTTREKPSPRHRTSAIPIPHLQQPEIRRAVVDNSPPFRFTDCLSSGNSPARSFLPVRKTTSKSGPVVLPTSLSPKSKLSLLFEQPKRVDSALPSLSSSPPSTKGRGPILFTQLRADERHRKVTEVEMAKRKGKKGKGKKPAVSTNANLSAASTYQDPTVVAGPSSATTPFIATTTTTTQPASSTAVAQTAQDAASATSGLVPPVVFPPSGARPSNLVYDERGYTTTFPSPILSDSTSSMVFTNALTGEEVQPLCLGRRDDSPCEEHDQESLDLQIQCESIKDEEGDQLIPMPVHDPRSVLAAVPGSVATSTPFAPLVPIPLKGQYASAALPYQDGPSPQHFPQPPTFSSLQANIQGSVISPPVVGSNGELNDLRNPPNSASDTSVNLEALGRQQADLTCLMLANWRFRPLHTNANCVDEVEKPHGGLHSPDEGDDDDDTFTSLRRVPALTEIAAEHKYERARQSPAPDEHASTSSTDLSRGQLLKAKTALRKQKEQNATSTHGHQISVPEQLTTIRSLNLPPASIPLPPKLACPTHEVMSGEAEVFEAEDFSDTSNAHKVAESPSTNISITPFADQSVEASLTTGTKETEEKKMRRGKKAQAEAAGQAEEQAVSEASAQMADLAVTGAESGALASNSDQTSTLAQASAPTPTPDPDKTPTQAKASLHVSAAPANAQKRIMLSEPSALVQATAKFIVRPGPECHHDHGCIPNWLSYQNRNNIQGDLIVQPDKYFNAPGQDVAPERIHQSGPGLEPFLGNHCFPFRPLPPIYEDPDMSPSEAPRSSASQAEMALAPQKVDTKGKGKAQEAPADRAHPVGTPFVQHSSSLRPDAREFRPSSAPSTNSGFQHSTITTPDSIANAAGNLTLRDGRSQMTDLSFIKIEALKDEGPDKPANWVRRYHPELGNAFRTQHERAKALEAAEWARSSLPNDPLNLFPEPNGRFPDAHHDIPTGEIPFQDPHYPNKIFKLHVADNGTWCTDQDGVLVAVPAVTVLKRKEPFTYSLPKSVMRDPQATRLVGLPCETQFEAYEDKDIPIIGLHNNPITYPGGAQVEWLPPHYSRLVEQLLVSMTNTTSIHRRRDHVTNDRTWREKPIAEGFERRAAHYQHKYGLPTYPLHHLDNSPFLGIHIPTGLRGGEASTGGYLPTRDLTTTNLRGIYMEDYCYGKRRPTVVKEDGMIEVIWAPFHTTKRIQNLPGVPPTNIFGPPNGTSEIEWITLACYFCFYCGSDDHGMQDCPAERMNEEAGVDFLWCLHCRQEDHILADCPHPPQFNPKRTIAKTIELYIRTYHFKLSLLLWGMNHAFYYPHELDNMKEWILNPQHGCARHAFGTVCSGPDCTIKQHRLVIQRQVKRLTPMLENRYGRKPGLKDGKRFAVDLSRCPVYWIFYHLDLPGVRIVVYNPNDSVAVDALYRIVARCQGYATKTPIPIPENQVYRKVEDEDGKLITVVSELPRYKAALIFHLGSHLEPSLSTYRDSGDWKFSDSIHDPVGWV